MKNKKLSIFLVVMIVLFSWIINVNSNWVAWIPSNRSGFYLLPTYKIEKDAGFVHEKVHSKKVDKFTIKIHLPSLLAFKNMVVTEEEFNHYELYRDVTYNRLVVRWLYFLVFTEHDSIGDY